MPTTHHELFGVISCEGSAMSHHCFSLALLLASLAGAAQAGGILVYEAGQPGSGLANAGAAVAADPSVLMNNPAGLSAVPGTQLSVNGQLILGDLRFNRSAGNQFDGNEGGNGLDFMPGSSLFLSHALNERATVGFGVYGTFGLAVNYDDDWAGRYFTQEAAVLGLSLQPTYAYRVNDQLAIGFGPQIMYGYFRTEAAIDNSLLGAGSGPDGQLEYRDSDVGVGLKLGMLYEPTERTRLGLAYSSKVTLEFEDRPHIEGVTNPLLNGALGQLAIDRLDVDMEVPQTVLLSLSHRLDEHWTLLSSLGWQDWSAFGRINVEVDSAGGRTTLAADRQYQDTWHLSLGTEYQASPRLRWRAGIGYDTSAVEDEDRTVDNPTGDAWRLATGVSYMLDEGLEAHASYTLVWLGDMDVKQSKSRSGTTLAGSYENSALHVLGGGLTWRY